MPPLYGGWIASSPPRPPRVGMARGGGESPCRVRRAPRFGIALDGVRPAPHGIRLIARDETRSGITPVPSARMRMTRLALVTWMTEATTERSRPKAEELILT